MKRLKVILPELLPNDVHLGRQPYFLYTKEQIGDSFPLERPLGTSEMSKISF